MKIVNILHPKVVANHCPSWFLSKASLTRNLMAIGNGSLKVKRLKQQWRCLPVDVALKLGCRPRSAGIERQVILSINHEPIIFAQTWMPHKSIKGDLMHLKHLRAAPLGPILFKYKNCKRSPIHFSITKFDSNKMNINLPSCHKVSRHSILTVDEKPFLITEVYLPSSIKGHFNE